MKVRANGPEIARRRHLKMLSRLDLALAAKCHERTIDRLERSELTLPATIHKVAKKLGCQYEDLVLESAGVEPSFRRAIASGQASSFVGRGREREALSALWTHTVAGNGSTVFVTGERGIGKTELIRRFISDLEGSRTLGAWVSCAKGGGEIFPLREMLEQLRHQSKVATRNIQSPFWMDTTLSSASELARGASTSNDIGVDLLRILNAYASEHPVVLIFEDLHRASKQSLELLELIARHNPGPLLLICEFRPLEAAVDLRELIKNLATSATMLRLEPFTIEDVRSLLTAQFGRSFAFEPWFAEDLLAWSGGTPFYLRLRLDGLVASGAIDKAPSGFAVRWDRDRIRRLTPDDQVEAVEEFLTQLQPEGREMLEVASVEGKQFHPATIAAVLALPADEVERNLHKLERERGILRRIHGLSHSSRGGTQQYEFMHGIFRDAVHAQLLPNRRAELSRKVATALVETFGEQCRLIADRMAELFEAGADFEKAAQYRLMAAENSTRRFDDYGGIDHAKQGLTLLRHLPESDHRLRLELRFNITLGILGSATEGFSSSKVESAYLRAEELSRRLDDSEHLFAASWGLWVNSLVRAQMAAALERCQSMLQLAESMGKPEELAEAYSALGLTRLFQGSVRDAIDMLHQGLKAYTLIQGDPKNLLLRLDPKVTCLSMLARAFYLVGWFREAVSSAERAIEHAIGLQQPYSIAFAKMFLSYIRYFRGETRHSVDVGNQSVELARGQGLHQVSAWAVIGMNRAMGDSATEREGCIDQIRMVIAQLEAADAYICCPQFRCMQAEIMVLNGTILQALNEVSRGVELARSSGNQDFLPELLRLNGQLLYMQDRGQIQTSLQLFQEAAAIAANQGAVGQRIRALMSSVALLAGTGNDAGASFRSELREVLSEVPSDQQECDALLAQEMLDTATAEPVVVDGWWTRLLRRY